MRGSRRKGRRGREEKIKALSAFLSPPLSHWEASWWRTRREHLLDDGGLSVKEIKFGRIIFLLRFIKKSFQKLFYKSTYILDTYSSQLTNFLFIISQSLNPMYLVCIAKRCVCFCFCRFLDISIGMLILASEYWLVESLYEKAIVTIPYQCIIAWWDFPLLC